MTSRLRIESKMSPWIARAAVIALLSALALTASAQDSQWVRPAKPGDPLIWGRRDGIVFGLFSAGGIRGPRGLIRIGLFTPGKPDPQLLNFIAVEPVVLGPGDRFDRMAFSELEMSQLDPGQRGKRMTVDDASINSESVPAGTLETIHAGKATVERLSVRIDVERYTANGAHVYVIASVDSDHPSELRLTPGVESDSRPIAELTLTATMGNYERLRLLWLNGQVIDSRKLFADYTGTAFAEKESYPLPAMLRTNDGDAIVFASSNEADPATTPGNSTNHWVYTLPKLTQYWRVPGRDVQPDLRVRVNARRVYWQSAAPVLGGIAFENFEVRERFVPGQAFIFGINRQEPWDVYRGSSSLAPYDPSTDSAPSKTNP